MSALVNEIVSEAIETLRSKPSGYRFALADLFATSRWEAIPIGVRRKAGTSFLEWALQHPEEVSSLGPDKKIISNTER